MASAGDIPCKRMLLESCSQGISTTSEQVEVTSIKSNSGALEILLFSANYKSKHCIQLCLMILLPETHVLVHGKSRFTHVFGPDVYVLGTKFVADPTSEFEIFSPNSHAPISLYQHAPSNLSKANLSESWIQRCIEMLSLIFDSRICSSLVEKLKYYVHTCEKVPSLLLFLPRFCHVTHSITKVKRFRSLFNLPSENCIPSDPEIIKLLGFTFREHDGCLGFQISSEMTDCYQKIFNSCRFNEPMFYPRTLICGPKGVGKSSLLRYLINSFLSASSGLVRQVAVLDCDVGQPEFTLSGIVSLTIIDKPLLGPPFSHQIVSGFTPVCQCFVGALTPSDDPEFYLECLRFVYGAYTSLSEPRPPLFVNTMGWTQGLGLTLLLEQILITKPNFIVQIEFWRNSSSYRLNLPPLTQVTLQGLDSWDHRNNSTEKFEHEVIIVRSLSKSPELQSTVDSRFQLGPPDHRDLMTLTYFVSTLAYADTSLPQREKKEPIGHPIAHLLDCVPYRVPITDHSQLTDKRNSSSESELVAQNLDILQNHLIADAHKQVPTEPKVDSFQLAVRLLRPTSKLFKDNDLFPETLEAVMACLNGTLVALCVIPSDMIEKSNASHPYCFVSVNPVCECLGFALCRAVDPTIGVIYLTTGVPEKDLLRVTGILRGNVNLPQCFFLEQPTLCTSNNSDSLVVLPYLGPIDTQGVGRAGLPSRRSYPRTQHHSIHRKGTCDPNE